MTEGTQGTDQQGAPAGIDAPLPATYNFADLWEANLKGADLTGAILNKTDLSRAIWTDGRICADSSVGECK